MRSMEQILNQILSEMQGMRSDIQSMKVDIKELQSDMQIVKFDIVKLNEGQLRLEQKVEEIHKAVVRLEDGQPKDIHAMLGNIDRKLDLKDSEINVLNKRVFKVETELEHLQFAK